MEQTAEEPLTAESVKKWFSGCDDFSSKELELAGMPGEKITMCYIQGTVRNERVNDYILRPIAQDGALARCGSMAEAVERMEEGALYNMGVKRRSTLEEAVRDLVAGWCVLLFPGEREALSLFAGTEEKRGVSSPDGETVLKGSRESFVESVRTNTGMVRRYLKASELKVREIVVGRRSRTAVDVLYLEGVADPALADEVQRRLKEIDVDAVLSSAGLEEYLTDTRHTAFPMLQHTERPDKFCEGLAEGRVGILAEGLAFGYLAPGVFGDYMRSGQDRAENWILASALTVLRYLCLLITLFLPALYIAMVTFHQEMIPTRLALSILAAKQDVPFLTAFEVLILLLAFELLQEAGLRLPQSIGQTVSIIGGLVVGSAAVEAKIISPAVLIAVSIAGIAGYTMPSQEFGGGLRVWRFALAVLAGIAGLFGIVAGGAALVIHLAGLESCGVPYLTPFTGSGASSRLRAVIREPMPEDKLRPLSIRPADKRRQK